MKAGSKYMNWLNKLERKFGRYAIPNLMNYIIILYGAGFVLNLLNPQFYSQYLSLNAEAILHGQVWRIVTFIIQPPSDLGALQRGAQRLICSRFLREK